MIYILCPDAIRTGGPEALHQLSDALLEQGFDARMVYYTQPQIEALARASPDDSYRFGSPTNSGFEEYSHYKRVVTKDGIVPNAPGEVIVLPEPLCHLAPKFNRSRVLVWWLSVDNSFGALSRVNLNHLRAGNVDHVAQSVYARGVIEALGLPFGGMLSDYTVDLIEYAKPLPSGQRPKLLAYNANHKVIADWLVIIDEIAKLDPEVECVPVRGGRRDVAELFAKARVYVDLGCMPGKDRMPREAASMNCKPLVLDSGAGRTDMRDWATDCDDLAAKIVRAVVRNSEWNWAAGYCGERDTFRAEVEDVFSALAGRT